MAAPAAVATARKRYVSAVYEDKYFPEKPAAVPFKWETTPGTTKCHEQHPISIAAAVQDAAPDSVHTHTHHQTPPEPCLPDSPPAAMPATRIYPLAPPPKLCPPSPLRVKDLLLADPPQDSHLFNHLHDQFSPHAYNNHHRFPWLSFIRLGRGRVGVRTTSAVVPIHKSFCILKALHHQIDNSSKEQHSAIHHAVSNSPHVPNLQGRSQSFSHATRHYGTERSFAAGLAPRALQQVTGRRCSSFNSLSAPHHTMLEQLNEDENEYEEGQLAMETAAAAAAAVWAGACILAAAAADHHHLHHKVEPCRVASKLKDLMQQSANFSEIGLTLPLALYGGGDGALIPAKKRTKSVEEEVVEAFLEEGTRKSCSGGDTYELTEARANWAPHEVTHQPITSHHALKKRKGFLSLLKSECIACWCPSPPY